MAKFKFNPLTGQLDTVEDISGITGNELEASDIDTLAELNAIITDATLIDTTDSRLSDARIPQAHTHDATDIADFDITVSNNSDVSTNTLKVSADGSVGTHSDVDLTTTAPVSGNILEFDGTNWIPVGINLGIVQDLAVQGTLSLGDWETSAQTGAGFFGVTDRNLIRWIGSADFDARGLTGDQTDGAQVIILNDSPNSSNFTLLHQSPLAGAAFQIDTISENDITLGKGDSIKVAYDTALDKYVVIETNRSGDLVSASTEITGTGGTTSVESSNFTGTGTGMIAGVGNFQIRNAANQGLIQILSNQLRISNVITNWRDFSQEQVYTATSTFNAIKTAVNMTNTGQQVQLNSGMQGYTGVVYKTGGQTCTILGVNGATLLGYPLGITLVDNGDTASIKQISSTVYILVSYTKVNP